MRVLLLEIRALVDLVSALEMASWASCPLPVLRDTSLLTLRGSGTTEIDFAGLRKLLETLSMRVIRVNMVSISFEAVSRYVREPVGSKKRSLRSRNGLVE